MRLCVAVDHRDAGMWQLWRGFSPALASAVMMHTPTNTKEHTMKIIPVQPSNDEKSLTEATRRSFGIRIHPSRRTLSFHGHPSRRVFGYKVP
jgi:hypothetical protein